MPSATVFSTMPTATVRSTQIGDTVVYEPIIDIVSEGIAGPPGPPGPEGPPGGDGHGVSTYEEIFTSASNTWTVDHNMDSYGVHVMAFDEQDTRYMVAVDYVSPDQVVIHWYYPMTGYVRVVG